VINVGNEVRREQISGEIQKIVSEIITNEIKDPSVPPFTSVISVDVTADMSYAKLHISALGDKDKLDGAVEGLKRASGFVRRELGRRMTIRHVPQLIFVADRSIEHSIQLQETLKKIHDGQIGKIDEPTDH
jgi:ribosome-binding factor A